MYGAGTTISLDEAKFEKVDVFIVVLTNCPNFDFGCVKYTTSYINGGSAFVSLKFWCNECRTSRMSCSVGLPKTIPIDVLKCFSSANSRREGFLCVRQSLCFSFFSRNSEAGEMVAVETVSSQRQITRSVKQCDWIDSANLIGWFEQRALFVWRFDLLLSREPGCNQ